MIRASAICNTDATLIKALIHSRTDSWTLTSEQRDNVPAFSSKTGPAIDAKPISDALITDDALAVNSRSRNISVLLSQPQLAFFGVTGDRLHLVFADGKIGQPLSKVIIRFPAFSSLSLSVAHPIDAKD